jgi:hypothetical protein
MVPLLLDFGDPIAIQILNVHIAKEKGVSVMPGDTR